MQVTRDLLLKAFDIFLHYVSYGKSVHFICIWGAHVVRTPTIRLSWDPLKLEDKHSV